MTPPFRILVVCIGNVCRSPFVERLLQLRLAESDPAYDVSSAGVRAMVGDGIHPLTAEQLVALGGDPAGFVSRQLTSDHVRRADLVLTATRELRARVLEESPAALRRTFTLRELAALAATSEATSATELVADAARRRSTLEGVELDVPDPMGRGRQVHASSAQVAAEAVDSLAAVLLRLARSLPAN